MKNKIYYIASIALCVVISFFSSCSDDDTFSTSWDNLLTFETDSLTLDTCFSTVPTPTELFMVYNNSSDGIRISSVRLQSGNQTGFRVNVNGTYLGAENGYQVTNMPLYKGDSLRVFVELTSAINGDTLPKRVEDNLIFTLENGRQQKVNLSAMSWDATLLRNYHVTGDSITTLASDHGKPIVCYGTMLIDSLSTLLIKPGTTLYFHDGAGIDVKGTLKIMGKKNNEVTLRCDRFDWMVSNLTYDNNPGQWGGIHLYSSSHDNEMHFTDLHAGTTAFLCDSAEFSSLPMLTVSHSTLHNLHGYGIRATSCNINIENSQISNTLQHSLLFIGGNISINQCTVAQYYPFNANRGQALVFANALDTIPYPITLDVKNSIIKGYADDVITWSVDSKDEHINALFSNCLLRTEVSEGYEYMFQDCIIENPEDTITAPRNSFVLFDTDNFFYNFTPLPNTSPIGIASPTTALSDDRWGNTRTTNTAGCYE